MIKSALMTTGTNRPKPFSKFFMYHRHFRLMHVYVGRATTHVVIFNHFNFLKLLPVTMSLSCLVFVFLSVLHIQGRKRGPMTF
jgi:hypothetical protein